MNDREAPPQIAQIPLRLLDGRATTLAPYIGQVLLISNIATRAPASAQIRALQELHESYRREGFVVLGFPSHDFRHEPGTMEQTEETARGRYGAEFPLFERVVVTGADIHPLFSYLVDVIPHARTTKGQPGQESVADDFEKFLVSRQGEVVARFGTDIPPMNGSIRGEVEKYLRLVTHPFQDVTGEWLTARP